jgi:ribosomal protein L30E
VVQELWSGQEGAERRATWDEAKLVVVAARVTVAVTLLAASYAKLTDFAAWQGAVNRLGGVRERLATPLAYVIPVL